MFHSFHKNKKGAPLSPNLLNLKSNTMKNTMQSYWFPFTSCTVSARK